jgi:hypothetical protein
MSREQSRLIVEKLKSARLCTSAPMRLTLPQT